MSPSTSSVKAVRHSYRTAFGLGVGHLWRNRRLSAPFLSLTLAQAAFQTLLIFSITYVLRGTDLVWGALVVFALWSLRAWASYLALMFAARIAYKIEVDSMGAVLRRMLRQPVAFFDRYSRGDLVISAYQDAGAARIVTLQVGRTVLYASRVVALGIAAWLLSPMLALVGLVCVPFALYPAYRFGHRIKAASLRERDSKTVLHDNFLQVAQGAPSIKVYGIAGRIMQRARAVSGDLLAAVIDRTRRAGRSTFLLEVASGVGLALMIGLGGQEIAAGRMDWQALLGILMALVALYQPVIGLLQSYNAICTMVPSLDKMERFREEADRSGRARGRTRLRATPDVIQMEQLGFAYEGANALSDISLSFKRGETIGIVGPTGAGKSTFMAVLMGLRSPTEGRVTFDGVDLRQLRERDVRALMALVPQEPVMFMGTISENIRLGRVDASDAEVAQAAQAAQIHDEIVEMPHGYDTFIGSAGVSLAGARARGLSVGQKQRVCIAAAILTGAPLVFLDEATSSVDSATERKIQDATEQLVQGRTAFMIAHRLSTLRRASRTVVLDRGRVVGFGTHEALLADCPAYQELWAAQRGPQDPGAVDHA